MTDRRAHQCRHDGCDSQATYQLWLSIQCGRGRDRIALKCESTVKVCDRHTEKAVQFLLSPGNKAAIALGLSRGGFPLPDFDSAVPIFAPVEVSVEQARKLQA